MPALHIELSPLGIQDLTLACACQDQHGDDVLEHRVHAGLYGTIQCLCLCLRQIPFLVVHNIRDLGRGELVFDQLRVLTPAQCLEKWQ